MHPALHLLELIGIFAFATSGALVAVAKRYDVVGLVVLAETTALGGGIVRDLIIGAHPPAAFTDLGYGLVPLAAAAAVLVAHRLVQRLQQAVLVLDAVGLGVFSVTGTLLAHAGGLGPLAAVSLGVVTAVGGGILRDLLAGTQPSVLRRENELYAIPSAVAGAIALAGAYLHLATPPLVVAAAGLGTALRLLALSFRWRAPQPS